MAREPIRSLLAGKTPKSRDNKSQTNSSREVFERIFPNREFQEPSQTAEEAKKQLQEDIQRRIEEAPGWLSMGRKIGIGLGLEEAPPEPTAPPRPPGRPQPVQNRTGASSVQRLGRRRRGTVLTDTERGREFLGIRTLLGSSDE